MIINPTKKALPIFNKLTKSADNASAKAFAMANPFFSWHTNYYSVDRKKIVVLVNDLTYATVVLYDINAKNKVHLEQYLKEGMRTAFLIAGISEQAIDAYFEIAGALEINAGFNRQVTGVVTNMIMMVEDGMYLNPRVLVQTDLMGRLMQTPYNRTVAGIKGYIYVIDDIQKAFENNLAIVASDAVAVANTMYKLKKTWREYQQWEKYEDDQALIKDGTLNADHLTRYEQVMNEVQANNQLLLAEFQNYLINSEGLSTKVVKKHVDNMALFVDEFLLYYTIKTPLKIADEVFDYLADWFPRKVAYGPSEVKAAGTSLKKFIKFMVVAGEFDQEAVAIAKESISNGIEMGVEHLRVVESMVDFW